MQPDQCRRPHPAVRALLVRLAAYGAAAILAVGAGLAAVGGLLPDGLPWPLAMAALIGAGWVIGGFAGYVVVALLHDRWLAALREVGTELVEIRRRYGLAEGDDDGTA